MIETAAESVIGITLPPFWPSTKKSSRRSNQPVQHGRYRLMAARIGVALSRDSNRRHPGTPQRPAPRKPYLTPGSRDTILNYRHRFLPRRHSRSNRLPRQVLATKSLGLPKSPRVISRRTYSLSFREANKKSKRGREATLALDCLLCISARGRRGCQHGP
jgi:hypothetical protein